MKYKKGVRYFIMVTIVMVGILPCFFVSFFEYRKIVEQSLSYVTYPVVIFSSYCGKSWGDIRAFFESRNGLRQQVMDLEDENQRFFELLAQQKNEELFIDDSAELQEYRKQYLYEHAQMVQVIHKQCGPDDFYFLIDAGQRKGMVVDMAVVFKNCLVGKIIEVFPYYSKVLLINDSKCKVASICTETKSQGIYQGQRNLQEGLLEHVDHLSLLQVGDWVVSSGEGVVFPRGFVLGEITSFEQKGVQAVAKIRLLLDFSKIAYCYVIQKGDEVSATVAIK